jgi:hypothetical protein
VVVRDVGGDRRRSGGRGEVDVTLKLHANKAKNKQEKQGPLRSLVFGGGSSLGFSAALPLDLARGDIAKFRAQVEGCFAPADAVKERNVQNRYFGIIQGVLHGF